ncbi:MULTISPECIES: amino acid transporter [unclassified Shinella]|uniref:nucleotidyltransferase domain-containing protein n=1 Tax=unclassified Shinella TaxID=2643062 RepID=UPI00225C99F2|nr:MULTISPECIES: amino acid transporter [unclassified Shinella]MCO5136122.1 amino acid transporter [Shinella sp.]MDC7254241.1 amino acid transporter [Shinella sp. YE25]CAI0336919.1 Amino acid transporter [Rhizobiaceae bacterium]CAK7255446.1 Amino acid transporter [Shinella sp. WSC3-e]
MTAATALPHDAWAAWHPRELARRLAGIARPWCVAGGWALDLWHGEETRPHEDLEFTILRADFIHFRAALPGLRLHAAGDGHVEPLGPDEMPPSGIAQVWCEDVAAGCWRVDMMLEDGTPETWVYKRDPSIRRPRAEAVRRTADGIAYLAPEIILLFKAKYRRGKDEADFARALPRLDAAERRWLKAGLALAHPDHAWSKAL